MAKRRTPIEGTLAEELFSHFVQFVRIKGGIPIERTFWGWLLNNGKYTANELPEWVFRYQFSRLVTYGWIKIDPETRTLIPLKEIKIEIEDT